MGGVIGANHSGGCSTQLHQIFSSLIDNVGLLYAAENLPEDKNFKNKFKVFFQFLLIMLLLFDMALLLRVEIIKGL